ncbi:MAG: acyl-CoA reductase, partial [Bacteroidota bacterium]
MLSLSERIDLLVRLGEHLGEKDEYLEALMHRTHYNNKWFTIANQQQAVRAIADAFLATAKIEQW